MSRTLRVVARTPRSTESMPSARSASITCGLRDDAGAAAGQFALRPARRCRRRSPACAACRPANRPLIEPPITISARRFPVPLDTAPAILAIRKISLYCATNRWRNAMALSMLDKKAAAEERSAWPAEIKAEFERESRQHNGCVGTELLSETDKVRVWIIRLQPGRAGRIPPPRAELFLDLGEWRPRPPAPDGRNDGGTHLLARARRGTRPMGRASTRCTTWKISATRR